MKIATLAAAAVLSVVTVHAATDWPQWQGPDRTRISRETGLLKAWPASGPAVAWMAKGLGSGYGSTAVAGDRVFVQGARGRNSVVIALNRADGKELWSKAVGASAADDRGPGPRGTPTVDGDRVYVLTESDDLACLKTDGTMVWQRNILRDFRGQQLQWLIRESPLVDGPSVIVTPGGPGAGMVKLDKMTGKTVWTSKDLSDTAGYASVIAADVQGVRTYPTFTAEAGVGVRASDGTLMFRYADAANRTANITTPVFSNNRVFFTSAYGTGGGLLDLTVQNGEVKARAQSGQVSPSSVAQSRPFRVTSSVPCFRCAVTMPSAPRSRYNHRLCLCQRQVLCVVDPGSPGGASIRASRFPRTLASSTTREK